MNTNYQRELERIIEDIKERDITPTLLLHSCCAPCSSYVLEYLSQFFSITVFFYNPNISPEDEYIHRVNELKRLIAEQPAKNKVAFIEGKYDPMSFYDIAKGFENENEGGERCFRCYRMRLSEAGRIAAEGGFDYFTTTLSISPMKNAAKLNEIGGDVSKECGVKYLYSDFKKKNGYKRSIELSAEYGLYRQNFCGCVYSMQQAKREGR